VPSKEEREPADEIAKDDRPSAATRADHKGNRDGAAGCATQPVESSAPDVVRQVYASGG
jgi:hypothetical protein